MSYFVTGATDRLNVNGTQHAVDLANELGAGRFHHASSIAVAGDYEGHFTEDSFDEGQRLPGRQEDDRDAAEGRVVLRHEAAGAEGHPAPGAVRYVASKAALDAFTRVASSETIGDNVTFTTIHMPLVRTPMIAPTKIYDSFPTISPEEAADLVCEAIRAKPKTINTRLGTFGEVAYALAPKAVDQILHMAYKVFPESTKKKEGEKDGPSDRASGEAMALAHLMKGVHW
jgi:NAD(P)-dependent dehydrogenase (short-subunit alcohol dehydrogenase family)